MRTLKIPSDRPASPHRKRGRFLFHVTLGALPAMAFQIRRCLWCGRAAIEPRLHFVPAPGSRIWARQLAASESIKSRIQLPKVTRLFTTPLARDPARSADAVTLKPPGNSPGKSNKANQGVCALNIRGGDNLGRSACAQPGWVGMPPR